MFVVVLTVVIINLIPYLQSLLIVRRDYWLGPRLIRFTGFTQKLLFVQFTCADTLDLFCIITICSSIEMLYIHDVPVQSSWFPKILI